MRADPSLSVGLAKALTGTLAKGPAGPAGPAGHALTEALSSRVEQVRGSHRTSVHQQQSGLTNGWIRLGGLQLEGMTGLLNPPPPGSAVDAPAISRLGPNHALWDGKGHCPLPSTRQTMTCLACPRFDCYCPCCLCNTPFPEEIRSEQCSLCNALTLLPPTMARKQQADAGVALRGLSKAQGSAPAMPRPLPALIPSMDTPRRPALPVGACSFLFQRLDEGTTYMASVICQRGTGRGKGAGVD